MHSAWALSLTAELLRRLRGEAEKSHVATIACIRRAAESIAALGEIRGAVCADGTASSLDTAEDSPRDLRAYLPSAASRQAFARRRNYLRSGNFGRAGCRLSVLSWLELKELPRTSHCAPLRTAQLSFLNAWTVVAFRVSGASCATCPEPFACSAYLRAWN